MSDIKIIIRKRKLRDGVKSQALFEPDKTITLTLDPTGVPHEKLIEFVGEALSSLRGAIVARWVL
jgi:hypothetical protein